MAKLLLLLACIIAANALLSNAQSVTVNENSEPMTALQNATVNTATPRSSIIQQSSGGTNAIAATSTLSSVTDKVMNEYPINSTNNAVDASQKTDISYSTESSMNESDDRGITGQPNTENLLPEMFDFNLDDFEDISNVTSVEEDYGNDYRVARVLQPQDTQSFEELTLVQESISQTPNEMPRKELDSRNIYKVANKARTTTMKYNGLEAAPETSTLASVNGLTSANFSLAAGYSFRLITELYDHNKWEIDDISRKVGAECSEEMRKYLRALSIETTWAIQAMDQSGRYRGLYMFGNEAWVGSKLFCEEINLQREGKSSEERRKQPALQFFVVSTIMSTAIQQNHKLQLGQCLPASCTTDDIANIITLDPSASKLIESSANLSIANVRTVPGEYKIFDDKRFHLGIAIVTVIFVFIATVYELTAHKPSKQSANSSRRQSMPTSLSLQNRTNHKVVYEKHLELHQIQHGVNNNLSIDVEMDGAQKVKNTMKETSGQIEPKEDIGVFQKLLLSFGLISNSRTILSGKKLPEESVSCIHGMRVFSMLWTIMVHTYLQIDGISENRYGRTITERRFVFQVIANATYAVDTFFFLSGLLVTLLFLRGEEKNKNPKLNTVKGRTKQTVLLVLYRYMRLTPVYFTALLCSEISLKFIYNRSVFQPGLTDHTVCPDYWWRNILYVQNWFPFPQLCMIWSWYLANDMQFYVWAIIILVISTRFFKTTAAIMCIFLMASWIISALISVELNYTLRISEPLGSFGFLYDKPWTRIGPYIMGMIAGYLIFRYKDEAPKVPKMCNIFMWIVSMVIMFFVIFGVWNGTLNVTDTAFYVSLTHTAWGFALIWITLSCKWGMAEPVNRFLSQPAFLPLSRLTYCTYLIHPVTQIVTAFQMEAPFHMQHIMVITVFLGNAIVSYGCAFVLSVLCEAPVVRMLKIIFK